ncbi:hypothetical protein EDB81DRAFT_892151 [Dactylonectria macrodidyma]|uniref:Uncharacterized protein n=1 Tax=Dactylonectria macrodidyma TaxID=307937 RepID=A0A9P9DDL7_9HYPO|nr:hypothetical protein EDB81DRAFT_892151 [Dactylonectria macrodidyma]
MNDIDTLCYVNFVESNVKAIVCIRSGTDTQLTTSSTSYLRGNKDHLCCKADNICMLSNSTVPEVACYDPTDKTANTYFDNGSCKLSSSGDGCAWTGTNRGVSFSTDGVTKITSVKDGKGMTDSGSGSDSGNGSGKSSSASVVSGSYIGILAVGALILF